VPCASPPVRTVSAGLLQHQLSRTSTTLSTTSSFAWGSHRGDRRQSVPSGRGPERGVAVGISKGKAQV